MYNLTKKLDKLGHPVLNNLFYISFKSILLLYYFSFLINIYIQTTTNIAYLLLDKWTR